MRTNPDLDAALGETLRELIAGDAGAPTEITATRTIGGGSISRTLLVESGTRRWFLKLNDAGLAGMFAAEADGLRALAGCAALRVPRVVGQGVSGGQAYLLLEHLKLQGL